MNSLEPFRIEVADAVLEDLKKRLDRTRWPDELPDAGWDYGVALADVRELARHWGDEFDWRKEERQLNQHPQFLADIDGQRLHFFHVRSQHTGARPLLLLHGWPGSVLEYVGLIDALTDPAAHGGSESDAFHVVIPSLPGFGFSGPTRTKGWSAVRVAHALAQLMTLLGYDRFAVIGNDLGSIIARQLGVLHRDRIVGLHVAQTFSFPSGKPEEMQNLTADEQRRLGVMQRWETEWSAYAKVQSTRPQSLAFALNDSPAGLLAWILDFVTAGRPNPLERDTLLANVSIYWFTDTIASSLRIYREDALEPSLFGGPPSGAPTGVGVFPQDFLSIRRFAERDNTQIVQWTDFPRGGHFGSLEEPELLIADVRSLFAKLR